MGSFFARILSLLTQRVETWTLTCQEKKTLGTQTITKFTEQLTKFDTVDSGSSETFDQTCNICDLYTEREAVGYCCVCEQYMCFQCCKHHEKISLSQNHRIVGKDDFVKLTDDTSLFERHLVPLTKGNLLTCMHPKDHLLRKYCRGCGSFISFFSTHNSSNVCCLISSESSFPMELGIITNNGRYKKIANPQTDIDAEYINRFIVFKGSNKISLMTCCNGKVYYKNVFTTSGACYDVAPFDNGLAISIHIVTGFSLPDWQIQYVDLQGNLKRQIYYDSEGKQLFKEPKHLASNKTEDILFVSDIEDNSVIALGPNGSVIYKFTNDSIQSPTGLTCDEENNVYVACISKVMQINKHGKKCRVLLDSRSKDITDICFYKQNRLAVIESTKDVTIFAFLP